MEHMRRLKELEMYDRQKEAEIQHLEAQRQQILIEQERTRQRIVEEAEARAREQQEQDALTRKTMEMLKKFE